MVNFLTFATLTLAVLSAVNGQGDSIFAPSSMYQNMLTGKLVPHQKRLDEKTVSSLNNVLAKLDLEEALSTLDTSSFDKSTILCLRDALYLTRSAKKGEGWAAKYMDSWGQEPSGSNSIILKYYGDYDQCLSIPTQKVPILKEQYFNPQYCYVGIVGANANFTQQTPNIFQSFLSYGALMVGTCVSSNCKEKDLPIIVNRIMKKLGLKANPYASHCYQADPPYNSAGIVAIVLFSFVAFLMLIGLLTDLFIRMMKLVKAIRHGQKEETPEADNVVYAKVVQPGKISKIKNTLAKAMLAFSPLTNFEKLVTVPMEAGRFPDFSVINGIRALSLFWVMLGHVYFFMMEGMENLIPSFVISKRFTFQFVIAGYVAVDTFLFLSGFLGYWSLARRMKSDRFKFWISLPIIYIHRWIRIAPPCYALILIALGLWAHLWNGPFYFQGDDYSCQNNWWANLLFINNFYNVSSQCVGWTWYLSVDMQLFILLPFVVYAFVRMPTVIGWALCLAGLVTHIVSSIALTAVYHLPSMPFQPVASNLNEQPKDYGHAYEYLYVRTYARLGPYVVGIICCHLLVNHEKTLRKFFDHPWFHIVGWEGAFITIMAIIYGEWGVLDGQRVDPYWVDCIYAGFARIAWGIAIGWIILAAAFGRAGIIGNILGWNMWALPARISYSAYLLHPLVYLFVIQTARRGVYFTDIEAIFTFLGTLVATLLVSTVYALAFESPLVALTRG